MTQAERRTYLITALLKEQPRYSGLEPSQNQEEQKKLLRALPWLHRQCHPHLCRCAAEMCPDYGASG